MIAHQASESDAFITFILTRLNAGSVVLTRVAAYTCFAKMGMLCCKLIMIVYMYTAENAYYKAGAYYTITTSMATQSAT